jgi:hypothetical protein
MNGNTYPSHVVGEPPKGLVDHWKATVPNFVQPTFVSEIPAKAAVYAYLPIEHISNSYVNDPHVHYHLAGKDATPLMTNKTTKLLANTQDRRPCVVKATHSMGGRDFFVIKNNDDEASFQNFLNRSGNPPFVVTEFIKIARNLGSHFFIHPTGAITFLGVNENRCKAEGGWSSDSTIVMKEQDALLELFLPYVYDVARYCLSLGFWGAAVLMSLWTIRARATSWM